MKSQKNKQNKENIHSQVDFQNKNEQSMIPKQKITKQKNSNNSEGFVIKGPGLNDLIGKRTGKIILKQLQNPRKDIDGHILLEDFFVSEVKNADSNDSDNPFSSLFKEFKFDNISSTISLKEEQKKNQESIEISFLAQNQNQEQSFEQFLQKKCQNENEDIPSTIGKSQGLMKKNQQQQFLSKKDTYNDIKLCQNQEEIDELLLTVTSINSNDEEQEYSNNTDAYDESFAEQCNNQEEIQFAEEFLQQFRSLINSKKNKKTQQNIMVDTDYENEINKFFEINPINLQIQQKNQQQMDELRDLQRTTNINLQRDLILEQRQNEYQLNINNSLLYSNQILTNSVQLDINTQQTPQLNYTPPIINNEQQQSISILTPQFEDKCNKEQNIEKINKQKKYKYIKRILNQSGINEKSILKNHDQNVQQYKKLNERSTFGNGRYPNRQRNLSNRIIIVNNNCFQVQPELLNILINQYQN